MALKPFYNKKGHLGMTRQQLKEALQSAKAYNADIIDGVYRDLVNAIVGTIQTDLPDAETAQAAMDAYYDAHDTIIIQSSDIPLLGDIKMQLYKSGSYRYFALFRLLQTTFFIDGGLSIENEPGLETSQIVLSVNFRLLVEDNQG